MTRSIKQAVVVSGAQHDRSKLLEEIALFNPDGTPYVGVSNLHADLTDTDSEGHPASAIAYEAAEAGDWDVEPTEVDAALDELAARVSNSSSPVTFVQSVDESGSSFSGWSTQNGTWASTGTVIEQSNSGATSDNLAVLTGTKVGAFAIVEAEIMVPAASLSNSDSLVGVGLVESQVSGSLAGAVIVLGKSSSNPTFQAFSPGIAGANLLNPPTLVADTWYTLRVAYTGRITAWLDDVLLGSSSLPSLTTGVDSVALYCYRGAQFRNIKAWEADFTLPS